MSNIPANKISLEKAKQDKLFYFVANAVIYRDSDSRCLILKRSEREVAHPGRYGVVGGKLEWKDLPIEGPNSVNGNVIDFNDALDSLVRREAKEESGVEIYPELRYVNSKAFIRPDGVPVVLIKFTARYKSGEVIPEAGAFDDYAWVNAEEVKNYDCIDGIPEEVEQSIKAWKI
ncbi:MAG: NUDIX domain-containing protein [Candidatus Pacebacteria bacterium]|nr:NUDIX domain-containing protein [Candidatus Paceibacterota bacterium]